MKKCKKCESVFESGRCKICLKAYQDNYFIKNKHRIKQRHAKYSGNNKHKIAEYNKSWFIENKEVVTKKRLYYRKTNIKAKIASNLRSRLFQAIKNNYKAGSAVTDLGCSIEEFKLYLESKFQDGMNWDNWTTDGWHLDHIDALANFDLTNPEEFKKACHYTNLQPLWAPENLKKNKF